MPAATVTPGGLTLAAHEALANPGSVGRPAPGVQLRLAGAGGRPVATGAVGDISLQAPNLIRGDHRVPALGIRQPPD